MSAKLYVLVGGYHADEFTILGIYSTSLRADAARERADKANHEDLAVWPITPNNDLWSAKS